MKPEITIAGGGLAGLSLGIGLRRRGISVVLHEAGSYPRHRVCGEFISGVSRETLQELGIEKEFSGARPCRESLWYREGLPIGSFGIPGEAMAISRWELDARLSKRFESLGGDLRSSSRLSCEPAEGFVWCAGRVPERNKKWIGLKCHLLGMPLEADLEMHVGSNGYAGLAGIEDGRVNVCGLFRLTRTRNSKGVDLLLEYLRQGGNRTLAARIEKAEVAKDSFCGVAGFRLGRQKSPAGVMALGDAESMIPPFTGNGMSMAFESAAAALDPLTAFCKGEDSWQQSMKQVASALRSRFQRRIAVSQLVHPFLVSQQASRVFGYVLSQRWLPTQKVFELFR